MLWAESYGDLRNARIGHESRYRANTAPHDGEGANKRSSACPLTLGCCLFAVRKAFIPTDSVLALERRGVKPGRRVNVSVKFDFYLCFHPISPSGMKHNTLSNGAPAQELRNQTR